MQFEIVLKTGLKAVPVRDIPSLIASAMHSPPLQSRTENYLNQIAETENEHRSALMASARYGFLPVLSSKTNQPTGENNPLAVVPVEAFTAYVAQFNIAVRFVD